MIRLGKAADDGVLWLALGSTVAAIDSERRRRWLVAGAAGPLGIVVNYPLKLLFGRTRPALDSARLGWAPNELSFPSAHATSSFASGMVMLRLAPRGGMFALALAAVVGVGRPYLGMHHPSDVLGGALFGSVLGWFIHRALDVDAVARIVD